MVHVVWFVNRKRPLYLYPFWDVFSLLIDYLWLVHNYVARRYEVVCLFDTRFVVGGGGGCSAGAFSGLFIDADVAEWGGGGRC